MRNKQSENGGGYLSDGHLSSHSSDNESASVCSEMVGSAANTVGQCKISVLLLRHLPSLLLCPSDDQPRAADCTCQVAALWAWNSP